MSITNMHNYTKVVRPQPFWAADFTRYGFILGYLWLTEIDFKICFKTITFK